MEIIASILTIVMILIVVITFAISLTVTTVLVTLASVGARCVAQLLHLQARLVMLRLACQAQESCSGVLVIDIVQSW